MNNEYGLDVSYFTNKMLRILRDMDRFTPAELSRECARMARTADDKVFSEPEFQLPGVTTADPAAPMLSAVQHPGHTPAGAILLDETGGRRVIVSAAAVNRLKQSHPNACIAAGLAERVGPRLYTRAYRELAPGLSA